MSEIFYKLPRLYIDTPMSEGSDLAVSESIHHYLKNVMRLEVESQIRVFNGKNGEFLGVITQIDKKRAVVKLEKQLKSQPTATRKIHLLFAPIRKERMDWLVEKAVELGATDLHPVLTQNTDNRKLNDEKIELQILQAAEQCERLDIPTLHDAQDIFKTLAAWKSSTPILAALERFDAKRISDVLPKDDAAFLIGPSGGFTEEEKQKLAALAFITPVTLGDTILRSETAVAAALASLIV